MHHHDFLRHRPAYRLAASFLEVQVAMVLMSIGVAGLYSMSVIQTRQTARLSRLLPADEIAALNRAGEPWQRKLGVYASIEQTMIPASPEQPDEQVEVIVDNDGSGVFHYRHPADFFRWYRLPSASAYGGAMHYHPSFGRSGSYAQFTVAGLAPARYEVLITYRSGSSLGRAIVYQIFDGGSVVRTGSLDQTVSPSQVNHSGHFWDRIGSCDVNSGTLVVRLLDGSGARRYIVTDAIMVRSRRSLQVVSVANTPAGGVTATLEEVP